MPHFRYTATDANGKRLEGAAEGQNWQEVDRALLGRGLKLTGIAEIEAAEAAKLQRQLSSNPPAHAPASASSVAPVRSALVPAASVARTRWGKDKEVSLLFSQVASYLRAGVNPSQAFSNLATNMSATKYAPALSEASQAASLGRSVADVLARHPYLFAPHVVGLYRAGEAGGFLPEATEAIADQLMSSHRFKRWFKWLGFVWISFLASWPMVVLGLRGLLSAWDKLDAGGGNVDGPATVGKAFGEQFVALLPMTLGSMAVVMSAALWWQSMPMRGLRHRLTLSMPSTGKRAKLESMSLFSWTLSNLFKSGMSPKSAVSLAASAMPNVHLSDLMGQASGNMRAETKLSDVANQVPLLTPEMRSIISTGEYVGDLPGALHQVAQAHQADLKSAENFSRMQVGVWMLLIALCGGCIVSAVFYRLFYDNMFQKVLGPDF